MGSIGVNAMSTVPLGTGYGVVVEFLLLIRLLFEIGKPVSHILYLTAQWRGWDLVFYPYLVPNGTE